MSKARKPLGRGLDAILGRGPDAGESIREIPVDNIRANPHQPRRTFDDQTLEELAQSIRVHGIVQPLIVTADAGGYTLVAGERRLRAARRAGLATVPAIVRDLDPAGMTELALIENLQREDLSPIEEALAYQALQEEFGLTQEAIAQRVGKSRSQVANTLRLLGLHPEVQQWLEEGALSVGHAKLLLSLASADQQRRLASQVIEQGWTVRRLSEALEASPRRPGARSRRGSSRPVDPDWQAAADQLQSSLGTRVQIVPAGKAGRGRIVLEFFSQDEFERLFEILAASARSRAVSP